MSHLIGPYISIMATVCWSREIQSNVSEGLLIENINLVSECLPFMRDIERGCGASGSAWLPHNSAPNPFQILSQPKQVIKYLNIPSPQLACKCLSTLIDWAAFAVH